MRIGIVSPYSMDEPGGVQAHCVDLAEHLNSRGHLARVLAPASDHTALPAVVAGAGPAVPVPFNGSVARIAWGPRGARRLSRWLAQGNLDVLHVHEPLSPSLTLHALRQSRVPVVATFHAAMARAELLRPLGGLARAALARVDQRIAVSEAAAATLQTYAGLPAQIIPNGITTAHYRAARPRREWQGTETAPTLGFLGRLDEPRKGLEVLVRAYLEALQEFPQARLLIAGGGDARLVRARLASHPARPLARRQVQFLGRLSETDKASFLRSIDLYVAPQTGGESFGIVLVEAMACGTPVLASDLPAFAAVLGEGAHGRRFPVGDARALANQLTVLLKHRADLAAAGAGGARVAERFDWEFVTADVLEVYRRALNPVDRP